MFCHVFPVLLSLIIQTRLEPCLLTDQCLHLQQIVIGSPTSDIIAAPADGRYSESVAASPTPAGDHNGPD